MLRLVLFFMLAGTAMVTVAFRPLDLPPVTPAPPPTWAAIPVDREDNASAQRAASAAQAAQPAPQPPSIQDIIRNAFQPLGDASVVWAEKIAFCESTYNPDAVNPSSGAKGLFQFMPGTWAITPYASSSPFDPQANAAAAAWLLQKYGPGQWECQA